MWSMRNFFWLVLLVNLPSVALAWGPGGHRIVGQIAEQHLTETAAEAIHDILGERTLADVSTWADEIKDQRPETSPWHYINPPPSAKRVTLDHCSSKGCVLSTILDQSRVLRSRRSTPAEKTEALSFVVHMVGDIHQPMHVSRAEDRGGNTIDVKIKGDRTNLHRAWDSGIMNLRRSSWGEIAEVLQAEITDEQVVDWSRPLDPAAWATESYQHAMGFAYKIPSDGELEDAYLDQSQNIIDERLKMGGVRLAALLNQLFDRQ